MKPRFGIVGLGFISERHINSIEDIGGELVVGCDIDHEKSYKLPDSAQFVQNWHALLEMDLDWVVICTPNNLHYPMVKAFSEKFKVICEKPFSIKPEHCREFKNDVFVVHQLRFDKKLQEVKKEIENFRNIDCEFEFLVKRDEWYFKTWKAKPEESGDTLLNIGVHYFDLMNWLFNGFEYHIVVDGVTRRDRCIVDVSGITRFNNAKVNWELSLNAPMDRQKRFIKIGSMKINLNRNMTRLHTEVYKAALQGKGMRPVDCKEVIKLINDIDT